MESENADDRRRGVLGLADSREGRSAWAVKVYETVARTDKDAMVRCAALRALGPVGGGAQIPLLLKLLDRSTQGSPEVRVAPGAVRWEAAKLLAQRVTSGSYEPGQREAIVRTLVGRASKDPDRNVRLTSLDALGFLQERLVLSVLIDVLDEDDFALQRAAEDSLMRLTGTTHAYDAKAWRTWLAAAADPFQDAGEAPRSLAAKPKPTWRWDWDW